MYDLSCWWDVLIWFGLMLNIPVNNFSDMLGRSHCFVGITNIFFGKYVLLKDRTQRPEWGLNPQPLDPQSKVLTTRPLGPPTLVGCKTLIQQQMSSTFPKGGNSDTKSITYVPKALLMYHIMTKPVFGIFDQV